MQALIQPVLVLFKTAPAQAVYQHRNDGGRQAGTGNDQQQFHDQSVTFCAATQTPAADGRPGSAEMAVDRAFLPGKSADLPFYQGHAMMDLSEKEDAPWMNSVALHPAPQAAADGVSSSQLPLLCWSCFMLFSQAVLSALRLTRHPSGPRIKAHQRSKGPHLRWKKPHLFSLSHPRPATKPKATHRSVEGGRVTASAFGMPAVHALCAACVRLVTPPNIPTTEVRPC